MEDIPDADMLADASRWQAMNPGPRQRRAATDTAPHGGMIDAADHTDTRRRIEAAEIVPAPPTQSPAAFLARPDPRPIGDGLAIAPANATRGHDATP